MVFYEITAVVDAEIASQFEEFMSEKHISDVLATGYFSNAVLSRNGERYLIRYEADHQSRIDQYLDLKAPLLRSMFLERFPTGVQLSRDTWEVLARFDPPPRR